jgi:cobalamin biosynthesis Co2+ chelatase CbiK
MLMEERPDFKDGVTEISWIDQPSKNIPSRFHSKVVIDDSGNPAVYKQIKIEVEERSCKFCSAKFSVAPSISRSDKEYCSDACKSKAYRFRKDKAVVLHNSGMSIPRIAAQLNVDEKQVMTWLRQLTTKS